MSIDCGKCGIKHTCITWERMQDEGEAGDIIVDTCPRLVPEGYLKIEDERTKGKGLEDEG